MHGFERDDWDDDDLYGKPRRSGFSIFFRTLIWLLVIILVLGIGHRVVYGASLWFVESVTPLGGSATFTGNTHDSGAQPPSFDMFGCQAITDQTGTLNVQTSVDNSTWAVAATGALTANTSADVNVRLRTRYSRCQLVNGATPQTTLRIVSSYTNN